MTLEDIRRELQYIADPKQPEPKYGGFNPRVRKVAKAALDCVNKMDELLKTLSNIHELWEDCPDQSSVKWDYEVADVQAEALEQIGKQLLEVEEEILQWRETQR